MPWKLKILEIEFCESGQAGQWKLKIVSPGEVPEQIAGWNMTDNGLKLSFWNCAKKWPIWIVTKKLNIDIHKYGVGVAEFVAHLPMDLKVGSLNLGVGNVFSRKKFSFGSLAGLEY